MRGLAGFLVLAALAMPTAAEPAESVDEVVARSLAALGGKEAWDAVETLELRGTFATFSAAEPFRMLKKRPDKLLFEHKEAGFPITVGYDGETLWWENHTPFSAVTWPSAPPVSYRRGYEADAEFAPPYLDSREKGRAVTFHGRVDFEGLDAHRLDVTLANGLVETWYLDAQSHLPAARVTRGGFKDFEAENRVFFSDYREVSGIFLPFHVESELSNLYRVMEIESVEVNVALDDALFAMPASPELERLRALAGDWRVEVSTRPLPTLPWAHSETTSRIAWLFDDRVLEEEMSYLWVGHPVQQKRLYTYDRFRRKLRIVQLDDLTAHPNLLEAEPGDGPILATNLETGTDWGDRGLGFHDRLRIDLEGPDSFSIEAERSLDGGQTWAVLARFRYLRIDGQAGADEGTENLRNGGSSSRH